MPLTMLMLMMMMMMMQVFRLMNEPWLAKTEKGWLKKVRQRRHKFCLPPPNNQIAFCAINAEAGKSVSIKRPRI